MPNPNHEKCKLLVEEFVKDPNWPKELKIAKKLLVNYSFDLLMAVDVENIFSLCFFLTDAGRKKIQLTEKLQRLDF